MELPKKIRIEHRKLSKKVYGSSNYNKQKEKLKKLYKKHTNKKQDNKNKIVSYLKNNYCHIGIQDENIKGWHAGLFGKQIQQSILGGIIAELKKVPHTLVVDRFYPSTKKCLVCGKLNKIKLSERIYSCSCGYEEDRDHHSSISILIESFNKTTVPMDSRDFKPVELNTAALDKLKNKSSVSIDYEAGRYNSLELC
jgi:transposase